MQSKNSKLVETELNIYQGLVVVLDVVKGYKLGTRR